MNLAGAVLFRLRAGMVLHSCFSDSVRLLVLAMLMKRIQTSGTMRIVSSVATRIALDVCFVHCPSGSRAPDALSEFGHVVSVLRRKSVLDVKRAKAFADPFDQLSAPLLVQVIMIVCERTAYANCNNKKCCGSPLPESLIPGDVAW